MLSTTKYFITGFVLMLLSVNLWGQTCCTAGAPVGTYLGIQNTEEKSLSMQLVYEYNSINLLVDNNTVIENDPRTRYGQNASLKIDYALNSKFAFSAIGSFVHQSRGTFSESQNSFGLGDLILITQYTLVSDEFNNLNLSAGVKLPIGKTNHRANSGLLLSPDLQSGSGSFDYLFRAAYSKSNLWTSFLSGYVNTTFRINGRNKDFGSTATFAGRNFGFGNESISQAGLNYLITLKKGFLMPDLSLRYRWADNNSEQNVPAPNSGGSWISLPIGISFQPDQHKSIAVVAEFPIYQNLEGLQITTNYKIGFQLNYTFQKKNSF